MKTFDLLNGYLSTFYKSRIYKLKFMKISMKVTIFPLILITVHIGWSLSDGDRAMILYTHNLIRSNLYPPAANMLKMVGKLQSPKCTFSRTLFYVCYSFL